MANHAEVPPCTTCMDEGWICYPHAESQRIECPGEECGTCDYAFIEEDGIEAGL